MSNSRNLEGREKMQAAGIPACSAMDDMVAVLPEQLGDAFFFSRASLANRSGYTLGWDLNASAATRAAVRRVYGPAMDFSLYREICLRVITHYISGATTPAGRRLNGEWEETSRVLGRMLPWRLAPFGFYELMYARQLPGHHRLCY
jgi:hypothetical protein